jgi:hypothetical protein
MSLQACLQKMRRKLRKKLKRRSRNKKSKRKVRNESPTGQYDLSIVATAASATEDKGLDLAPQKDDDPDGVKLLTSPDPLERAWKLLSPLLRLSIKSIDLWVTIYDVAVRRGGFNEISCFLHSELL